MVGGGAVSPERWGVQDRYRGSAGEERRASTEAVQAVMAAMGAETDAPPEPEHPVLFVRDTAGLGALGRGHLDFEHGGGLRTGDTGPGGASLPFGYHRWTAQTGGRAATVVVSPGACLRPGGPAWGWAVQLYAMRSRSSWGIGDLADLRDLGQWSREQLGAGLVLVNPLHAAGPALPQAASPYFPSSRRFRNPLYLRVEQVPGAHEMGEALEPLAAAGRDLNRRRLIRRDEIFTLKMEALGAAWEWWGGVAAATADPDFGRYRKEQGPALAAWSAYCVLAERHGNNWRRWPPAYRHPERHEVAEARAGAQERALFHEWLQWQLDTQLAAASSPLPVVQDLAVGFEPDGADAWLWQDALAPGMSVGAPPDEFNAAGQDWGLPPFDPWRLRAAGYQPFIETMRAALRHAGGLRVDHVMGLFRLFWVPHGGSPADGAYVRYPAGDLLDILCLESHRAGAYVVGEDLGTVEDTVRTELAARNVLSYRLVWFEDRPPSEYPVGALAAVTTHDLPTVAGVWSGHDFEAQARAGMQPGAEAARALRERVRTLVGVDDGATVEDVIVGAHSALGRAPSMLLTASLDDALAVEERPNMPGTTDEFPNWSMALPLPLEEIRRHPLALAVADAVRR